MKHRALTLVELLVIIGVLAVAAAIVLPSSHHNRGYARRVSCLSNLKSMGMALQMYVQDSDALPPRKWNAPIMNYASTGWTFQCPETGETAPTSDYFFNARFASRRFSSIKSPKTLILFGDGQDDAPLDATLSQIPAAWRTDENSPSFRHLGTANYLFGDGHVKSLQVKNISRDFRTVSQ